MDQVAERERNSVAYRPAEVVVDVADSDRIVEELERFGITVVSGDPDPHLGLTLLQLTGPAVADRLQRIDTASLPAENALLWNQAFDLIEPTAAKTDARNLDVALHALRERFEQEHGRKPQVGKNRLVDNVGGWPYIIGGGEPFPVRTAVDASPFRQAATEGASGGGSGVKVGIADTRIFPHPKFAGSYRASATIEYEPKPLWEATAGHATFVSGCVLDRAPAADLVVVPVLDDNARATTWQVATRLMRFLHTDVKVIPLAFGCFTADQEAPMVLTRAMERLLEADIVVLAAAGNHGLAPDVATDGRPVTNSSISFPAGCRGVVGVGANVGPENGPRAEFSPRPNGSFQLMADGDDLTSTYLVGKVRIPQSDGDKWTWADKDFDGGAIWSGTSFAVATVAGEIARRTVPGQTTAHEVLDQLLHGGGKDVGIHPV